MAETIFIVPPEMAPETGERATHETPYGRVEERGGALLRTEGIDPRALIYAAKAAGATQVLAADRVEPVSPLLEPGDLVVPADTIDQTRLRPFTFFVGKGYGFIKLDPPFCPDLMAALLAVARQATPRAFRRATYVGTDGPREATPAELRMYRTWGADVLGTGLLPEAYLARELELCYAALTAVGPADLLPLLRVAAGEAVPGLAGAGGPAAGGGRVERTCACGRTMAFARAQGLVGEDWRQWL